MIKQDFINCEIVGKESYILTEFEMLVKNMANKVDKDLLKKSFKRGLELQEQDKELDKHLDGLSNEQLMQELSKALQKLVDSTSEDLDEDYD